MTYVEETHRLLGALLRLVLSSSNFRNTLRSIAVSLSFGDLSWRRLVAATASRPLLRAPLAPLPFLVFSRLSSLDNNAATVEIFLVELSNSFFDLGNVFDRDKAIASRAGASLNNLDRQAMRSVLSNKYKSENFDETHMSPTTLANTVFNPSSVVAYARLPTKIWYKLFVSTREWHVVARRTLWPCSVVGVSCAGAGATSVDGAADIGRD